jgi:hypothetical protein
LVNFESPRFATGYTSLFNAIGFVVETYAKKYADRATYEYMRLQLISLMLISNKKTTPFKE